MSFGTVMAGANKGARRENDFYETPVEATEALIVEYSRHFHPVIWEPAVGAGKLARVLEAYGFDVFGTDLVDRGYGFQADFLTADGPFFDLARNTIITNPPFNLASEFIRKGMSFRPRFFALLLKQTFWNVARRADLWGEFPPVDFRPLTFRLDWTGGGSPTMDCAWCIWGEGIPTTGGRPLRKPTVLLSEMLS